MKRLLIGALALLLPASALAETVRCTGVGNDPKILVVVAKDGNATYEEEYGDPNVVTIEVHTGNVSLVCLSNGQVLIAVYGDANFTVTRPQIHERI